MAFLKIVLGLVLFGGSIKVCLIVLSKLELREQRGQKTLQGVKMRGEQREWSLGEVGDV